MAGDVVTHANDVGFGFDDLNPIKHAKKLVRGVGRAFKDPVRSLGTVANIAPGVALAASGGGLGLLAMKGGAEAAANAGAPKVLTTFADPSGALVRATSRGASSGLKKGGAAGLFRGALSGSVKGAKDITSNPLIRATAAGLTFVVPPAGVALSGGLAALDKGANVAGKLVSAMEHGDAAVKAAVAGALERTAELAKLGDLDAKRALLVLSAAKTKLVAMRSHTYFVSPSGQISRGKFAKVASGTAGARVGFYVRADGHVERGAFKAET